MTFQALIKRYSTGHRVVIHTCLNHYRHYGSTCEQHIMQNKNSFCQSKALRRELQVIGRFEPRKVRGQERCSAFTVGCVGAQTAEIKTKEQKCVYIFFFTINTLNDEGTGK